VNPAAVVANHNGAQRALLIVGSPKVRNPSTSAALGGYLASQLANRGWETETLKLKASTTRTGGQAELLSTVNRADLLILAFPLYIDSPPLLVLKALETIAADRSASSDSHRPRLAVISNNGFPEAHHNAPAIAMCHEFALQTGMTWAGALAMGAGEAISSGQPLAEISASGLPTGHVLRALETAAAALAAGRPIPEESMSMIASVPIPGAPVQAWHQVFLQTASQHWVEEAAAQGVSDEQLRDRPYAELEMSCA
jgi:hypothetical protein